MNSFCESKEADINQICTIQIATYFVFFVT